MQICCLICSLCLNLLISFSFFSFCRFNKVSPFHSANNCNSASCQTSIFFGLPTLKWSVCVPSSAVDMCIQSWSRQYLLFCRLARLAILLACDSWLSLILRQIVAKLESNAYFGYDMMHSNLGWPHGDGDVVWFPPYQYVQQRTGLSFFCQFNYNYQRFVDLSVAAYRIDRFEARF